MPSLVAVNASPRATSRTAALAESAVAVGGGGRVVHLCDLPADALLGRRSDPAVDEALDALRGAERLVLATPVYRATYAGLLKVVLDQIGDDELRSAAVVLAATAGSTAHFLALDAGLRPVVTTLGAVVVPDVVYATPDDFGDDGRPGEAVVARMAAALDDAAALAGRRRATLVP